MALLIYGAYGYTGRLITERAVAAGLKPILAGRSADKLLPLASTHRLDARVVDLDTGAQLDEALVDIEAVLHCAGPFVRTAQPMAEACLRTQTHYLDITGEIDVFERLAAMDERARAAGVQLLPGTGFDVVPTDCLARHLHERMPEATALELAFMGLSGVSRGTATTAVEQMGAGGAIRRGGQLMAIPPAAYTRRVDFGPGGTRTVTSIPWGDLATAYRTTGIPNITTYAALGRTERRFLLLSRYLGWLLASAPAQVLLKWLIQKGPEGPSEAQRTQSRSYVWGRVEDRQGRAAEARLELPEGYALTARAAVAIAQRVLAGDVEPGYQTPAGRYGADLILSLEDTERVDLDA